MTALAKNTKTEIRNIIFDITCNSKRAIKLTKNIKIPSDKKEKMILYKNLLRRIYFFNVKKNCRKKKDALTSFEKKLKLFNKKVFILRYGYKYNISDIAFMLNKNEEKIKKSLLNSCLKLACELEGETNEM